VSTSFCTIAGVLKFIHLHRFFDPSVQASGDHHLPEDESRHAALILRLKAGDLIEVLNGKGGIFRCEITEISKKVCKYRIHESREVEKNNFNTHLIIAPTKNMDRMEWLVEKLVEVGVYKITFIAAQNSERRKLRLDRLEKKAISALKQSGNPFLLELIDLIPLNNVLKNDSSSIKLIAHVDQTHKYISNVVQPKKDTTILIGPEGDFTKQEVEEAIASGYKAVSLGPNTLRTETAGLVACCYIGFINK